MSFVAVVNLFLDAQLVQHQDTTDTQQVLLLHTVFPVAAIQLVSDGTVPFAVLGDISIHQVQRNTSNVHFPNICINDTSGIWDFQHDRFSVFIGHLRQRQQIEVLGFIVGYLLSVHGQCLCKVSITIKETDRAHVDVVVTRFFQIVACQDTQATGIDFQDIGQTILHAEVGYGRLGFIRLHIDISPETSIHLLDFSHQFRISQDFFDTLEREALEQLHRVA